MQAVEGEAASIYANLRRDTRLLTRPTHHRVPWAATHISEVLRLQSMDLISLFNNSGLWETTFSPVDDLALRRAQRKFYEEKEGDKADDVYRAFNTARRAIIGDTNAHPYMRLAAELVTAADANVDDPSVRIHTLGGHILLYAADALVSPPGQPSPASPRSIAS